MGRHCTAPRGAWLFTLNIKIPFFGLGSALWDVAFEGFLPHFFQFIGCQDFLVFVGVSHFSLVTCACTESPFRVCVVNWGAQPFGASIWVLFWALFPFLFLLFLLTLLWYSYVRTLA